MNFQKPLGSLFYRDILALYLTGPFYLYDPRFDQSYLDLFFFDIPMYLKTQKVGIRGPEISDLERPGAKVGAHSKRPYLYIKEIIPVFLKLHLAPPLHVKPPFVLGESCDHFTKSLGEINLFPRATP